MKTCKKQKHKYNDQERTCPECRKIAHHIWSEDRREELAVRERDRRTERRKWLRQKREIPCKDCGIEYPWYQMDFDHRERGGTKLAWMLSNGKSFKEMEEEIQWCDIVCVLCHRRRTYERAINNGEWNS